MAAPNQRSTPEQRVKAKYLAAFCERDSGGYNILFKRKHIHYIICAGSRTELAAWRKAVKAIYDPAY